MPLIWEAKLSRDQATQLRVYLWWLRVRILPGIVLYTFPAGGRQRQVTMSVSEKEGIGREGERERESVPVNLTGV